MTEKVYEKKSGNGCVVELYFEGRLTHQQLEFLAEMVKKYKIHKTTLNQSGNLTVWNLRGEILEEFLADVGKEGIAYGSAYFPRRKRVVCAPLAGIEEGESFDVFPYAEAARGWLEQQRDDAPFAVYFSNSPLIPKEGKDCNMVFGAVPDGLFEVWAGVSEGDGCLRGIEESAYACCQSDEQNEMAGCIGEAETVRKKGIILFRLAEKVDPGRFLSYIKIGYAIREKAGNADEYRSLFWQALAVLSDEERRPAAVEMSKITKTGNGNFTCGPRVIKQKQEELYAVRYHPLGGVVNVAFWHKLLRSLEKIEDVQIRLDSRMNLYVCNLLAEEVGLPMEVTADGAFTAAEFSPVQSFCGLCTRAACDAQMFAHVLLKETKKLGFGDGVLPTFTVAGCTRACGAISDTELRFLAETVTAVEPSVTKFPDASVADGKMPPNNNLGGGLWFTVESRVGPDRWHPIGRIPHKQLTEYLIALGALPQSAGLSFQKWRQANPGLLEKITALYGNDEKPISC